MSENYMLLIFFFYGLALILLGIEAIKRIRESEKGKKIPIIALTAYAMAGDRQKPLAASCTGYIEKPIDPDTFISEIEKYL